jgi:hypothetical protein
VLQPCLILSNALIGLINRAKEFNLASELRGAAAWVGNCMAARYVFEESQKDPIMALSQLSPIARAAHADGNVVLSQVCLESSLVF